MKRKLRIAQWLRKDVRLHHALCHGDAPGFITTETMPTNAFRAKDLSFYVN